MSDETSPRAHLVELLWQLKRNHDQLNQQNGKDGKAPLRLIHFNTLLNDAEYRAEVIQEALESSHPRLRELGRQLSLANRQGALLAKRATAAATARPAPDTRSTPTHSRPARRGWLIGLASLTALAGLALALQQPLRTWMTGEQVVSDSISDDTLWTADRTWVLDDIVYVEDGASLSLEPGTRVEGRPGSALVITRGARLHAAGRADAPIVFSSHRSKGSRQPGDWGGLILLGSAPVNVEDAQIEGVPATDPRGGYGGSDAQSSCGVLEYARIEFAGFEVYANNELNGLTLGGCGSDTLVRHVQVHRALDDGVEMFGGTADLRHVLISGPGDDGLDWDLGWRGRVQFLIVQQHGNSGDNGFESDNNGADHGALPRSEPWLYNVTLVSPRSHDHHHRGMTLREGTGGHFRNLVIHGFAGEAVDIRDTETVANIQRGELDFQGLLISHTGPRGQSAFEAERGDADDDGGFDEARWFQDTVNARFDQDPLFARAVTSLGNPDFTPGAASPLKDGAVTPPQGEFWDEAATYLGAIRPGAARAWTDEWTDFPLN